MTVALAIALWTARCVFALASAFLFAYAVRHYLFALWRLVARPRTDTMELVGFRMPRITVLVPMHNEEAVANDVLRALLECDYDWDLLQILAVDDRSQDRTSEIIDGWAADFPVIQAVHIRAASTGNLGVRSPAAGKAAALAAATADATGDILLVFDADYLPGHAMLKMLAAAFLDPQVGAVMGRVVPHNAGSSLLAGLLALERAAGYQAVQQSRWDLLRLAQFGGTVGGVRRAALEAVGGWNRASLTEDTDLTCRLLLAGWRIGYLNRAECYEQVPERWPVRRRQLTRWVTGHTQCFHRYWRAMLGTPMLSPPQKLDALFMLACYWTAPAVVLAWSAALVLFFAMQPGVLPLVPFSALLVGMQLFANQATFVELGVAALLDGTRHRILLLPLSLMNFFASTGTICGALARYYLGRTPPGGQNNGGWYKTERTRRTMSAAVAGGGANTVSGAAGFSAAGLAGRSL